MTPYLLRLGGWKGSEALSLLIRLYNTNSLVVLVLMTQLGHRFGDDGEFWIPYELFLQKFETAQCLRLLTKEWDATQKWISLNIPFVEDYHKTKFVLSLAKTSPIVIVLSQVSYDSLHLCCD
jgi:hypothetical protein